MGQGTMGLGMLGRRQTGESYVAVRRRSTGESGQGRVREGNQAEDGGEVDKNDGVDM